MPKVDIHDCEESRPSRNFTRRVSRSLRRTVSRMAVQIIEWRLHLAFYLSLPSFVALTLCWAAGLNVWNTMHTVLELASISGAFACFYDTLSQLSEVVYLRYRTDNEAYSGVSFWQQVRKSHDILRTVRYAGVHFVYNGPYHMPKLLFLNWMYPGAPTLENAFWKWLWAELVFSPGESLGVLSGVQIMKDGGSLENVCQKLRNDLPQFQSTKWVGHALPHYLSFLTTTDIIQLYMYNFGFKAFFEIFLAIVAARPIKNKSRRSAATDPILSPNAKSNYGTLDKPILPK